MSKKRRDKDFVGDIKEAIEMIGLYTRGRKRDGYIFKREYPMDEALFSRFKPQSKIG